MSKKLQLLVIVCIVILIGCTAEPSRLPGFEYNRQISSAQGLIVVRIDNFDYLDLAQVNDDPTVKPRLYRIRKPSLMFVDTYAKALYSIEPGTYYISFIAIDSEKGVYYSEAPGIDAQGNIAYGAFTVKPDEVLYLGDVACQWKSTNKIKKLDLMNNIAMVKKDLTAAGYDDLAQKIVQAKFYAHGVNLSTVN